jgi:5'-nucleotidase
VLLVIAAKTRFCGGLFFVIRCPLVLFQRPRAIHHAAKQAAVIFLLVVVRSAQEWISVIALWKGRNIEYSERAFQFRTLFKLKILVSNDDGYLAKGINSLADALAEIADVVVVAPEQNRSGASNSLTLHSPLRVKKVADQRYFVNGTPSDCVHLALAGFLEADPDIVVSGINHGANLGDDVIYSGTVAAAMEGRFLGLPAIAISLVGASATHFDTAARVAADLVGKLQVQPLPADIMLNVNVPDRRYEDLQGFESTRLGFRHRSEPMLRQEDPYGRSIYWIGPAGVGQDAGPGTDFHAVERGAVAITPLKVDLTRHEMLPDLTRWLAT